MRKLSASLVWVLLMSGLAMTGCGSDGPEIAVGLNVRDLCQRTVSGEPENRCVSDDNCGGNVCWRPAPASCTTVEDCEGDEECTGGECIQACTDDANCREGFLCTESVCQKRGYCRECLSNANCGAGECDHGWCHPTCSSDGDCGAGFFCTGGFCRKPHIDGTSFNFCNNGSKDLEVYLDQTKLYGEADACAYARWEWVPADQTTVVLGPDECSLYLKVQFTPPDTGEYFGYMEIMSNSGSNNPLPLLIHGQAVEAACEEALDAVCEPVCTSTDEDYADIIANRPEPSCN